jgi:uncharacterized protein with PIN domain
MTYFDCFVVGSWIFVIGWYLGAIYVQNRSEETESPRLIEETESPRLSEKSERCPECEAWRVPVAASASAD